MTMYTYIYLVFHLWFDQIVVFNIRIVVLHPYTLKIVNINDIKKPNVSVYEPIS